jgi:choline-sulfatase
MGRALFPVAVLLLSSSLLLIACDPPPPPGPPPHVLLISVDSMRADRLALYHPDDGVRTPRLEALARSGVRYADAWATSPWTAPSMVSIMTGLYPPSHGVVYRDDTTPPGLPTLPRLLGEHGYRLGNFTFFSQISYFRNLGLPEPPPNLGHDGLAAAFDRWLDAVPEEQKAAPVFAWLHLLEPHLPYGATGYRATEVRVPGSSGLEASQLQAVVPVGSVEFADGDRQELLALYDADVARMDEALGEVLAVLDRRGMRDDTVIVVVADHGEELLEDGWIGHASTAVDAKLLPQIVRIPLVLAGPGVPAGAVEGETVQGADVFPTLLRLAGVELPAVLDGRVLPGMPDLLAPWEQWTRRPRERAFFDSSPGGNLTPVEQRDERVQGVTDGRCLLESRVRPGAAEETLLRVVAPGADCAPSRTGLERDLEAWRAAQGRRRLEVLEAATGSGGDGPDPEAAEGWAETLAVAEPTDGAELTWSDRRGQLVLEWRAPEVAAKGEAGASGEAGPAEWWVQYRVGRGVRSASGTFRLEQQRVVFGPFPHGFWDDVASYSPFRFRVLDPAGERRSPWVTFRLRPVTAEKQREAGS